MKDRFIMVEVVETPACRRGVWVAVVDLERLAVSNEWVAAPAGGGRRRRGSLDLK